MRGVDITYSAGELEFVEQSRELPREALHRLFVCKFNRRDVSKANLDSLCKRKNWMTGRTGRFEKGNIPHPDAGPKGANKTSFKKGNKPHNWVPVFSTRLSKDGYLEIKTKEPRTWEQAHIVLWGKYHGEVPAGFCLAIKNGRKADIILDNLELISRNENLRINQLRCSDYPDEIRPTVRALGKLIALTQGQNIQQSKI